MSSVEPDQSDPVTDESFVHCSLQSVNRLLLNRVLTTWKEKKFSNISFFLGGGGGTVPFSLLKKKIALVKYLYKYYNLNFSSFSLHPPIHLLNFLAPDSYYHHLNQQNLKAQIALAL